MAAFPRQQDLDPRPIVRPVPLWVIAATAACLIGATLLAYWPTLKNGFVRHDDGNYLVLNEMVGKGLTTEGFAWAFAVNTPGHAGFWHPVTWLSHMLDVELFKRDQNGNLKPAGHHGMGMAIHALNAVLVLLVLRRMTGSFWCSALAAALFALHPLRVESVAWAAERKELLSTFFGLLALWAYAGYAARPAFFRYALVVILMSLSLMAKPMLVTLPFLLLLLDYWPLRRWVPSRRQNPNAPAIPISVPAMPLFQPASISRLILEKVPLAIICAVISAIVLKTQREFGAMHNLDLTLGDRIANALISYIRYLGKTVWPVDMAVFYPHPLQWPAWHVLGAAALLLVITAICLALVRRHSYLLVGWLWFVGTLVPVIGLVQVGLQSMADRFVYFPQIGILIMASWGFGSVIARFRLAPPIRYAGAALSIAVLVALGMVTHEQIKVWRDAETLDRHAIAATTDNYVVMKLLGAALSAEGRNAESLELLQRAAETQPDDAEIQSMLAEALLQKGDFAAAIDAYDEAVNLDPDRIEALNNLAWMLCTHPDWYMRDGARAVELARRACDLKANQSASHLDTLAAAYAETGDFTAALATAKRAHELALAANDKNLAELIGQHIIMFESSNPIRMVLAPPQQ